MGTKKAKAKPKTAPELITDRWIQGKPVTMRSLRGKLALLHFWRAWPYEWSNDDSAELSWLARMHKKYGNRGLTVVTVLSPMTDETYVRKTILENEMDYPIGVDAVDRQPNTEQRFREIGFTRLLVDRKGTIIGGSRDEIESQVQKALGK